MDAANGMTLLDPATLSQEAARLAPIIAVIWYMLRDVRASVATLVTKVAELDKLVASNDSRLRIDHVNEKLSETKSETKSELDDLQTRLHDVEKQLPKIWVKVGDRPEDIKNRLGG